MIEPIERGKPISDERTLRDQLVAAGTAAAEKWLTARANRRMSDVNRKRLAGHVVNALWQEIEQATVEIAGWVAEDNRAARDAAILRAKQAEEARKASLAERDEWRRAFDAEHARAERAEAALATQQQEHRNAYLVVMEERDDARNRLRNETTVARDLLQRNIELGTRADNVEAALVDLLERLGETGEQWGVRGGGGTFAVLDEAEARWHMFDPSQPMTPVRRIVGEWRDATPRNAAERAADEQGDGEGSAGN